MRTKSILLVAIPLVGCSLAAFVLTRGAPAAGPDPGSERTRASQPAHVTGLRVATRPVRETLMLTGNVLAQETVALRPETAGKVTRLLFEEGGTVSAGELLVQLNDAELSASLDRARHRHRIAFDRESRLRQLAQASGISQEEYDRSIHEQRVALADIAVIEAQLAKMRIVAPYDGIVGLRQVSLGSLVGTGDVVAQLQVIDRVKVEFAVPERHRAGVAPGLVVRFRVAGLDEWFDATVYAIEPAVDLATRTTRVRAVAPNPTRRLVPGAFAELELPLHERPDGVLVPTIAVQAEAQRSVVFVHEDGRAQPRPVQTGTRFADEILILGGLEVGEVVITSGLLRLRAGAPVQVELVQ